MHNIKRHNILLACGGSGGHLIPALVLRKELLRRGHTVFLSVSDKKIDADILLRNHIEPSIVLRANSSSVPALLRPIRLLIGLVGDFIAARRFIKSHGVEFVLGMGGFNCAAPLLAACSLKIPRGLHESNVIPGRVTRLFKKSLDVLFIGFEHCCNYLKDAKNIVLTGTPTRYSKSDVYQKRTDQNYHLLGLEPQKKTVLLLGGSQGSEFLNKLLADSASLFAAHRDWIQFIHISGKPQPSLQIHPLEDIGVVRKHYQFYNDMDELYALADVVVARSGSGVISEILKLGLKTILVPLSTAADNHQWHNAKAVEMPGFIEILEQKNASPNKLLEKILLLLQNKNPKPIQPKQEPDGHSEVIIANEIEKIISQKIHDDLPKD